MAHFAELDSNNIVQQVIVVANADIEDDNGVEQESIGIAFCQSLFGSDTIWKQTSYNATIRKNYAGIGYSYDSGRDAFVAPQPYASWVLDDTTCIWKAPIDRPELTLAEMQNGSDYRWDEDAYQADTNNPKTAGWVAV